MNIKMIMTDLDATLLNKEKEVSSRTLATLEKCRQKGILIGVATARSACTSTRILEAVKPDITITSSGAVAVYKGDIVHHAPISLASVQGILAKLLNEPAVKFISAAKSNPDEFLTSLPVDANDPRWKDFTHAKHVDFAQMPGLQVDRIVPLMPYDVAQGIAKDFDDVSLIPFRGDGWVQFAHKSVSKFNAVEVVAKHLGVAVSDIVAFGDDVSDIEMIKHCGIGVAMDNAIDDVKAVADFVTIHADDDGVAVWLEENVL